MKGFTAFKVASLLSALSAPTALAQAESYTHPATGITFWRQTFSDAETSGGLQFGWALPASGSGNAEYIGYIKGSSPGGKGYTGISHSGGMTNSLLLAASPDGTKVKAEFLWAPGYVSPDDYTGNATITKISETVGTDSWELVYRCQWCWAWDQNGASNSQIPQDGSNQVVAWAQHKGLPSRPWAQHNNGQGTFGISVDDARNAKYSDWVGGVVDPPPTTTSVPPTVVPTATQCVGKPAPTESYDYIVVGAGAGGIPVADKLSEAGKKVLLIEKGPPSLARFGGTMKPDWLKDYQLTRFDVPGLCNQIWVDSAGIACTDTDQMAGCVLGGGTAVNAALWWKPVAADWDVNFPSGWKSSDIKSSVDAVFKRIPGTDTPSTDGKRYKQEGFNVLSTAFAADGWKQVTANNVPDQKNRVYSHSPFMYEGGQRGGPLGTYLVTALGRTNFKLLTNTGVRRVVRTKGLATGVELESGYCGTVKLNAGGRVILSAGAFGSSKLLFRSGIGPTDQLNIVKGSPQDGASFIKSSDWINLPVGQNLNDHVNTDLVVQHKNVSFYDFYQAWTDPIASDKKAYLESRSGILAQSAPNIGPLAWEVVKGSDGKDRQFQWTARVEGPKAGDNYSMTISNYLGRGSTSRGAATINSALSMTVSKAPYLNDKADTDAVIASLKSMAKAISKLPSITWQVPEPGVSIEDYVASLPKTPSARRANHWIGTAKVGTDSGLKGGTAVVNTNLQVYGTNNIHVVDASIFPGHITTNPTSYIVTVGEHAAKKILALKSTSTVA